jgi:predicted amidohydrolase
MEMPMKVTVATCQFPVSADVTSNLRFICDQMREARSRGADVAHFPEASLSGYANVDFASFDGFDWTRLREATRTVMALAGELQIWTVIGSAHELSGDNRPLNCSYIIDGNGRIADRYDKIFCAGDSSGEAGDLRHYSPGNHFAVFEINGVRCGALICHDYRYPELYREYKKRGVQAVFHSYHAANVTPKQYSALEEYVGREHRFFGTGGTLPAITMPAGMIASASNNYVWISCPNSAAGTSCWGSFFVRPDGVITGALEPGNTGLLLSTMDTEARLYDSTAAWRDRAINGTYHSGVLVDSERSRQRTEL